MTELLGINVRSIKVLKAVGALCPRLKSVSFMDCTLEEIDDPIDFASPLEMEMLLKEWPLQVQIFVSSTVYLFIFI